MRSFIEMEDMRPGRALYERVSAFRRDLQSAAPGPSQATVLRKLCPGAWPQRQESRRPGEFRLLLLSGAHEEALAASEIEQGSAAVVPKGLQVAESRALGQCQLRCPEDQS